MIIFTYIYIYIYLYLYLYIYIYDLLKLTGSAKAMHHPVAVPWNVATWTGTQGS